MCPNSWPNQPISTLDGMFLVKYMESPILNVSLIKILYLRLDFPQKKLQKSGCACMVDFRILVLNLNSIDTSANSGKYDKAISTSLATDSGYVCLIGTVNKLMIIKKIL